VPGNSRERALRLHATRAGFDPDLQYEVACARLYRAAQPRTTCCTRVAICLRDSRAGGVNRDAPAAVRAV
jgi:hypothetical protein